MASYPSIKIKLGGDYSFLHEVNAVYQIDGQNNPAQFTNAIKQAFVVRTDTDYNVVFEDFTWGANPDSPGTLIVKLKATCCIPCRRQIEFIFGNLDNSFLLSASAKMVQVRITKPKKD